MIIKFLLSLGLLFGSQHSFAFGAEGDSGIKGPKYSDLVSYFSTLPQKYPQTIELKQYGTTLQGRPLIALKVSLPARYTNRSPQAPAILITGSTHGDEYLNIEDRIPEWFASAGVQEASLAPFFRAGGSVYIIPIYNPDGYDARRRGNSRGVDLNRDFTLVGAKYQAFKEVESIAARNMIYKEIIEGQRRLLLSIDYHCCIGAALYPWSFRGAPALPEVQEKVFQGLGQIMKSIFGSSFRVGKTPTVLGYSALGTSKDYYYETYGAYSFTYEGEERMEKNKFSQHIEMWKKLIGSLYEAAYRRNY